MKPRLLDLFCGAGGASMGYHRAGFEVVGVDLHAQPRYPFLFEQGDALAWMLGTSGFDAIHASPPCQHFSQASRSRPGVADKYPDLIEPVRAALRASGLPYVIENVVGAPLESPIVLCGSQFGKQTYRHRLFESNIWLTMPDRCVHKVRASKAGHWKPGTWVSVAGNCAPIKMAREAMDIDWMTREELSESIPPYFTEFIGKQILAAMGVAA